MSFVNDPHWRYFLPRDEEDIDVKYPVRHWDWQTVRDAEQAVEMAANAIWGDREGYEWMLHDTTVIGIVHDDDPPVLFNVSTDLVPSFYGTEEPDRERRNP